MAYIYKITNDINGKIYIGKTEQSVENRFREHCQDYKRRNYEKRPLYAAMRKYGVQHFHVEQIEETDNPEERECYWIEYFRSFKNGYNATMGGDGKKYIDYDLVINTYKQIQNAEKTAKILGISSDSVSNILKMNNIPMKSSQDIAKEQTGKIVYMYSLNDELIKSFISAGDAARYLIEKGFTKCKFTTIRYHISEVCQGKRKTTAGFKWSY